MEDSLQASNATDSRSNTCYLEVRETEGDAVLQVAIALSLLTAAVAKPPFNQLICTFSATPELHVVKGDTLVKQASSVQNHQHRG